MKCKKDKLGLIILVLVAFAYRCSAQTNLKKAEQQLSKQYSRIFDDPNSSDKYSEGFGIAFKKLIKENPSTINYDFKVLRDSNNCKIITSDDGNLRIYSWDTWTGGTMHFYNQIYQFRAEAKVFTQIPVYEEGDPGEYCTGIYTVPINGQTYYLVITNGRYSSKDHSQSVSVYTINGNQLHDTVKLFKTRKKLLNSIDIAYDFYSVVNRPNPLELITFDRIKKEIYIPLVDDNDQVTDKHLVYQLKGNYFEYVGVQKGDVK